MDSRELRAAIESARDAIFRTTDEEETRRWCRWVMEYLKRASERLVEGKPFSHVYPEQAGLYARVLRYHDAPISHVGVLATLLKRFGRWLVQETERRFGGDAGALPRWKRKWCPS
jgi:hypothetical protein